MKIKHWILLAVVAATLGAKSAPVNVCGTIDAAIIPEFVEAFTYAYGYRAKVTEMQENGTSLEVDNPETALMFTKRKIFRDYPIEVLNAYKIEKARREASVQPLSGDAIGL